ncbi:MAG TPA: GtrA family protein [Bacillales bacterium]|nr:GtrA family protein [Bacillales bacterium]
MKVVYRNAFFAHLGGVMIVSLKERFRKGLFQYGQFSIIGVTSGILDLGSLNLLLFLFPTEDPVFLTLFNTIAYSLAVLNSYIWNAKYTFREGKERGYRQKLIFVAQAGVSLIISDVSFVLAIDLFHWFSLPSWIEYNASKGASMFLSATSSFFFMKFFVFRKRSEA